MQTQTILYTGWINNKVPLHGTGNYTQCPVINHNGKEYEKEKKNEFAFERLQTSLHLCGFAN